MNKSDIKFHPHDQSMLNMAKHICALGAILLMPLSGVNAQCVITDEVRIAAGTMAPPFNCGDLVSYQGYEYATVQIGDQCWFSENLRNENYQNGDAIPADLNDTDWANTFYTTQGAVAVYNEDAFNLETYGRLYNWYAVDDARGLCPSGWHVPTDAEWTVMTDHLGGESIAGGQMKSTSGWDGDGNGSNSSEFTGLPGGYREYTGVFKDAGSFGGWWSSTADGYAAWGRFLSPAESVSRSSYFIHRYGMSVRCIEDSE